MQVFGEGHAAAVIHAIVATQAGTNVVLAAFPRFFDKFGIGHGGPGHEHIVRLAFGQHVFGHGGIVNAAHQPDGNFYAGLLDDFTGPGVVRRGLKAGGVHLGPGERVDAVPAGDVGHIDIGFEYLQLFGAFLGGDAAFHRVAAVDAQFDE